MIERNEYLDVLKRFKDKELIKVITGIRRCGKSTLLELYKEYLLSNGITEDQIININLDSASFIYSSIPSGLVLGSTILEIAPILASAKNI